MKKIISFVLTMSILIMIFGVNAHASVIRGKRYYIELLKEPCGFKGDVMGAYHTKKEWKQFYDDGTLGEAIQKICPMAPLLEKKRHKHIYHFVSSFASDSGNIPSCN